MSGQAAAAAANNAVRELRARMAAAEASATHTVQRPQAVRTAGPQQLCFLTPLSAACPDCSGVSLWDPSCEASGRLCAEAGRTIYEYGGMFYLTVSCRGLG